MNLTHCRVVGELNLSSVELGIVPNPRYQEILEYSSGVMPEEEGISISVGEKGKSVEEVAEENVSVAEEARMSAFTGYDGEGWRFEPIEVIQPEVSRDLKVVESNITIDNCILEDGLDFSYSIFKKPFSFTGVNYSSNAVFTGSYFYNSTYFQDNNFCNTEDFSFTTFNDNASFIFTTFNNSADFFCTNFNSTADFQNTIFNNDAYFLNSIFKGDANFYLATFKGATDFSNVIFNNITYFGETTFKDALFQNTTFENISFFITTFEGATGFWDTTFKNVDSPWDTNFKGNVEFDGAIFEHVTDLSFASFNDTAIITGPDTPENVILNGENSQIFIKSYKDQGRYDDADTIYYNYRKGAQAQKEWNDFSKWVDIICWITCGYGVRPSYTLYLGVTLILLFSIIYAKGPVICFYTDRYGIKSLMFYFQGPAITIRKEYSENQPQKVSFWDALNFSITTFTTVGYGNWYPKENFKKWATLEGLFGWIILGIFMATLSTTMIRV